MLKYIILCFLSFTIMAETCPKDRADYFCLSKDKILNSEINETSFYQIPIKIYMLYFKEISEKGYPFLVEAKWESPYFGAGVSFNENAYHLMILGGMARMKEMTKDAYAAIVCHEIGHLLGGDPKQTINGAEWATAEGGADYFSASKCLPKYFDAEGIKDKNLINQKVEKAGFEFINLATVIETEPSRKNLRRAAVSLPAVKETLINKYPSTQCRYEIYRNSNSISNCWFKSN